MAQPYVGEIRIFAGNFAPSGWLICAGQLLAVYENDALFSLIGTTYGGDGQSTFGLPDLRGRAPLHMGQSGGSSYTLGQMGGVESVTLISSQMPTHSHGLIASGDDGNSSSPSQTVLAKGLGAAPYIEETPAVAMNGSMLGGAGGGQPHENLQPFLTINYIISLYGIYPSPY